MNKIAFHIIRLFCVSFALLFSLIRLIRVGTKRFFAINVREIPPPCLLDPGLGTHGYLKLKDVKLHYVMNGDTKNPLMVCLHGFPEFWFSWRHQLREFSREYCVIAVDMRGYGDSDKPTNLDDYMLPKLIDDIHQLIQHFTGENGNAVVMAHDWGGAYQLAAKYPESVNKLIVGNAPHLLAMRKVLETSWEQLFKSWYIYFILTPNVPEFILRTDDLALLSAAFRNGKTKLLSNDELEAYKYIYSKQGAFTPPLNYYRANFNPTQKSSGTKFSTYRVTVPTLLIWGDQDMALSLLTATTSSEFIDNFNLRVIQGASHWVQMDKYEEFNSHAWNFLRSG